MGDPNAGLFQKFIVTRTDGSSNAGGKHNDCEYFVLDLTHDEFALSAITAYAMACSSKYPKLAQDLLAKYMELKARRDNPPIEKVVVDENPEIGQVIVNVAAIDRVDIKP